MYLHRHELPPKYGKYKENGSSKIHSPVFARVRIQAPHVLAQKLIPQGCFPACIGFVPGSTGLRIHSGARAANFKLAAYSTVWPQPAWNESFNLA